MAGTVKRSKCRECGRDIAVRKDGKLRAHHRPTSAGYYVGARCPGTLSIANPDYSEVLTTWLLWWLRCARHGR